MGYCLTGSRGYELLIERYRPQHPRGKGVAGQGPQPSRSPLGVLAQRRQAHEACPRTNRAICQGKEEDPEIRGGLGDDGSDVDSPRKQAFLARGTLTGHTMAAVALRLHHKEIRHIHSLQFRLDREGAHADQNGRNGTPRRAHPRPPLEGGL